MGSGISQSGLLFRRQHFPADESRSPNPQVKAAATQRYARCHARGFPALRFAADLHDYVFTFGEPGRGPQNLAFGQKGRPVLADVDKRRAERRDEAAHPAKMDAAHLATITPFNKQLNGKPALEQHGPPFARAGGDQQLVRQRGR